MSQKSEKTMRIPEKSRIARWGVKGLAVLFVLLFFTMSLLGITEARSMNRSVADVLSFRKGVERMEKSEELYALLDSNIWEVIRFVVIRDQFETNGKYNAKKLIDIQDYAQHKNLGNPMNAHPTVTYYLEDLIRWGAHGVYRNRMTQEEFAELSELYGGNVSESTEANPGFAPTNPGLTANPGTMNAGASNADYSCLSPSNEYYLTTEGKRLIQYAKNIQEYSELTQYLQTAAEMAYLNYNSYTQYLQRYSDSNFLYYIAFIKDGEWKIYSNLNENRRLYASISEEELSSLFSSYGNYFFYDYDTLTGTGNLPDLSNTTMRAVNEYYYAFKSNVKLWFGVADSFEHSDSFAELNEQYTKRYPALARFLRWTILIGLFALIGLTVCVVTETVTRKRKPFMDYIPTEPFLLLYGGLYFGLVRLQEILWRSIGLISKNYAVYDERYELSVYRSFAPVFGRGRVTLRASGIALLFGLFFALLTVSLLCGISRRVKGRKILRNSLLYRLYQGIESAASHRRVLVRTVVPYGAFIVVNAAGVLLGFYVHWLFWIPVVLVDLFVGVQKYRTNRRRVLVLHAIEELSNGNLDYQVDTSGMDGDNLLIANSINEIKQGISRAIESDVRSERMRTDLITNVSHDIKTPLTSIISYIDLIKRENTDNENIVRYIAVLDQKSQRLKQLTDDLVEASKISSGNISVNKIHLNLKELLQQALGEFDERLATKNLQVIVQMPEGAVPVELDASHTWRIIENLLSNIVKYALPDSRVYVSMECAETCAVLTFKNISEQKLNISAEELTERFIRGDIARSSEGSGLGLSIAKNLTKLQGGELKLYLDGDLFKVTLSFPLITESEVDKKEDDSL